jgi:ankyrin repeat protein
VELVKEKGCYFEEAYNGTTPLHGAAKSGNIDIVNFFLERREGLKIEINHQKHNTLHTPLHFACFKGHFLVVKALIEAGANVNAKTNANVTPLYLAAKSGSIESIELLLSH